MDDEERIARTEDGRWMVHARAKLNLGLRIFPVRPDGFHDLETWMAPISWYDTLWVSTKGVMELTLEITGRTDGVPTDIHKNLVGRAALALAEAAGIAAHAKVTLHKVLPPGGGLGGGSSDAANVLVLLNEAWRLHWGEERLIALAAQLGSDVPFFVRGQSSLCTGRGEIMTSLPCAQPLFAVLIASPQGCPTKDVYRAFDAGHRHAPPKPSTDWKLCAAAAADELGAILVNDLEPPAFHIAPWLGALRDDATAVAGQPVHMTGSGSTLFTLCTSGSAAHVLQRRVSEGLQGKHADCTCIPVRIG